MLTKSLPNSIPNASTDVAAALHTEDAAQSAAPAIASPCTGVCQLQSSSGYCQGCLRTLDEIAAWGQADESYKRAVMLQLAQRELTP